LEDFAVLRRADQRRFDQRTAFFEAQAGKDKKPGKRSLATDGAEEKERKFREIFGMAPL
jgi:hypothetical protein